MTDSLRPLLEAAKGGDATALNQLAGCVDRFVRIFSGSLSQSVRRAHGSTIDFEIDPFAKQLLLAGTDELGYLLSKDAVMTGWEAAHPPRIDTLAGVH